MLYVQEEMSFDRHHVHADRIHRILRETLLEDGSRVINDRTSGALAEALVADFPEVEQAARVSTSGAGSNTGRKVSLNRSVSPNLLFSTCLPIPLVRFGLHDFLFRHDRSAKFDMDRLHAIFSRVP
jgi:hypothetical protein